MSTQRLVVSQVMTLAGIKTTTFTLTPTMTEKQIDNKAAT